MRINFIQTDNGKYYLYNKGQVKFKGISPRPYEIVKQSFAVVDTPQEAKQLLDLFK